VAPMRHIARLLSGVALPVLVTFVMAADRPVNPARATSDPQVRLWSQDFRKWSRDFRMWSRDLSPGGQPSAAALRYPPPRFVHPARRAKLEAALAGIEPAIREQMDRMRVPGLAWGVVIDGELVRSGGMGVRETASAAPVDADTVFRIASMTKSFTALAILQLRDAGTLSLDDPVTRHVPEFASVSLPTSDSPAITIRHLLTHSEGLPEDNPWGDRQLAVAEETLSAWLLKGLPFSTPPATAFEYSNYGFALLGRIVANASGMPYDDYVTRRILQPLGMTSTAFDQRNVPSARLASGYRPAETGWVLEPSLSHGAFGSMGGLFTSARDLGRYVAFMSSAWPPRDDEDNGPVKRSSLREMQQGQRLSSFDVSRGAPDAPISAAARAYGYGLEARTDCRVRHLVAHGGGLPGFGSNMTWLPEHGVGVLVMANRTYAAGRAVARVILERLAASGALQPRRVVPSPALVRAHDRITALVNRWNDGELKTLAADNLLLDRPLNARRTEFTAAHERLGTCQGNADIDAENWLRGTGRLNCERGTLTVAITLAPTEPPLVQHLELTSAQSLAASLAASVASLAALVGRWDEPKAAALLAPELTDTMRSQARSIAVNYGPCRMGDVLAGDGRTDARVRLTCDRGRLDVHVETDAGTGRIRTATFAVPPGDTCAP
jgi:CubicO group peptidase (beta-lactamase class C family)